MCPDWASIHETQRDQELESCRKQKLLQAHAEIRRWCRRQATFDKIPKDQTYNESETGSSEGTPTSSDERLVSLLPPCC